MYEKLLRTLGILAFQGILSFGIASEVQGAETPVKSQQQTSQKSIVFLGDSLTAGYGLSAAQAFPGVVQEKVRQQNLNWKVVNAGVSGDTTAGGVARLNWIYKAPVDVLFVALGANDGLRGIRVEEIEKNLRIILDRARKEKSFIILAGMQLPENYGPQYRQKFSEVFAVLAKDYSVPFIPFLLENIAMNSELNQRDGVHPNAQGARLLADSVWKTVGPLLKNWDK
jgi:acyl-CoA thioesterase-1